MMLRPLREGVSDERAMLVADLRLRAAAIGSISQRLLRFAPFV